MHMLSKNLYNTRIKAAFDQMQKQVLEYDGVLTVEHLQGVIKMNITELDK